MAKIKPLEDAVDAIDAKTPIGSVLRSADWEKVPLALRQRAQFSAGVTSARVLQTIQDRLSNQISLRREQLDNGKTATFDRSSFIDSVRQVARDEGLTPANEEDRGGIKDITSIPRLGLIYDMQNQMAAGYAQWKLDQSEGALLLYPAAEFVRVEDRKTPREESDPGFWDRRWIAAANEVGDDDALRIQRETGRKIALKTSGIWAALSRFGTPWMPFDYGSGMGMEDVDRDTAIELGLIDKDEVLQGGEDSFNEDLQASVKGLDGDLKDQLKESFGKQIKFKGDTAWWTGDRQGKRLAIGEKPAPAAEPAPEPTIDIPAEAEPVASEALPSSLDQLQRVKSLGGSTGAELMRDKSGNQFVVKRGNSPAHVREEFAADQIYQSAGVPVPEATLLKDSAGNPVKVAKFVEGKTLNQWLQGASAAERTRLMDKLQESFFMDALTGNWDVAGLNFDNIIVDPSGTPWRIDNGGALRYRAQGEAKTEEEWNDFPLELWTMRDAQVNAKTAELFSSTDFYKLAKQIESTDFERIIAAAPPELRDTLAARAKNLKDAAAKAIEYQDSKFTAVHADRITEEIVRLRQAKIPDLIAGSLRQTANPTELVDADGKSFDNLRASSKQGAATARSDPSQYYYNQIVPAVKTINHHHKKGDTDYGSGKIEQALAIKPELQKLATSGSASEKKMAAQYLQALSEIEAAKGKKDVSLPQFKQYAGAIETKAPSKKETAIQALASHVAARGGDWDLVSTWAGAQGGSSTSGASRRLKRWLFERLEGVKAKDFHGLPKADVLSGMSGADRQKYDRSFETFHAFMQEMLSKMEFSGNDRSARMMRVLRTEQTSGAVPFSPGEKGVYKRGVNESGSVFTPVFSGTKTETVVPHPRITSIYFLERDPGSGNTFLYGDSENEATFMAHGLEAKNVTGLNISSSPGTDNTKWATD